MPNSELTVIQILIDASGSMTSMRNAVVSGLNEFMETQRQIPGNVIVNVAQFDSDGQANLRYEEMAHFKNIRELPPFTHASYVPKGGTPLLQAQTKAINDLGEDLATIPEHERPGKVVFLTITDGQENSSGHDFTKAALASKIKHQTEKYNWEFMYIGANQDAFAEAASMGYNMQNVSNYSTTARGTATAFAAAAYSTNSLRSTGSTLNMAKTYKSLLAEKAKDQQADETK